MVVMYLVSHGVCPCMSEDLHECMQVLCEA